jgi:hypothetical protein
MSEYKSSKSGTPYRRLQKKAKTPDGLALFVVKMKQHGSNIQMQPRFIATQSREDAEKVVAEDYQTDGHGYL